jgi:hypothetical protein
VARPSIDAARAALARGDVRTARRIAREIAASGSGAERDAALRLLGQLAPDPAALIVAAAVLVVIAVAAWLALFRSR